MRWNGRRADGRMEEDTAQSDKWSVRVQRIRYKWRELRTHGNLVLLLG